MELFELIPHINTSENAIQFLRDRGILRSVPPLCIKKKNKEMCGTTQEMLPSYLDEFQWRQLYGKKTTEAFDNILAQIAHTYNEVNNNPH